MATTRNKTSVILEQQLPDFVREEYATFIAFLKSYYEFLELSSPPTKIPFIVDIPDLGVYAQPGAPAGVILGKGKKPYGIISTSNNFISGEKLIQRANPSDPSEITGSAILSFYSGNATSQTAIVTSFGGTQNRFVKNYEIEGEESGVAFWPAERVVPVKAGAERVSLDVFDYKNIDETLDDYIQYIKNEFAVSLPGTLHKNTDTKTTIKNLRDFYRARGTEDSFKLLFRILYGENAEVYLPQDDMLLASHGEWYDVSIIRTNVPFIDSVTGLVVGIDQIVGRKIKQLVSGASAVVERATTRNYVGYIFAELELSDVTGTFNLTPIITESIGDGTHIEVAPIGMLTDIKITDGGSNYKQGDTIAVTGGGGQSFGGSTKQAVGAIAQVRTTNSVSGEVLSVDIIEPGLFYSSAPTLDLSKPHSGDEGAARFSTGPLKTVFYNDFSKYKDGNTFFTESDNRGGSSNVGGVGNTLAQQGDSWYSSVSDPAYVTSNSYANFITVPGVERGLKGWWRMNNYSPEDVTINSQDGLLSGINAGNSSPLSNAAFWIGPLVRDVLFLADRKQSSVATTQKNYFNPTYYDPNIANTYSPNGWFGFQPTILDESGHGHHAYIAVWRGGQADPTTINLYSEVAFANTGVLGAGSNSLGTFNEGGVVLMPHDDIRHANTQSWVFWYYPYEHSRYSVAEPVRASTGSEARIISRDRSEFWSLVVNNYSDAARASSSPGDFTDTRFTFLGGKFDNLTGAYSDFKLANSAGYFPGGAGGIDEGGTLRLERWNMIALTIDYNDQGNGRGVANIYFFNTDDGLLLANGVSIGLNQSANTPSGEQWSVDSATDNITQGRGVVLGENCESANGDSFASEDSLMARGGFDEVRYYDKALTELEVVNLFRNPGGKYDKTLSGDWAMLDGNTNHWSTLGTANVEFLTDTTALGNKVVKFGQPHSAASGDGIRIVHNKNILYDPATHYKLSVRAKDAYAAASSNAVFGIIGISNTGTRLLGHSGQDDYNKTFPLSLGVGDGTDGTPYTGSLGPEYAIYTGVFGGSTVDLGLATSGYNTAAHGGNTEQSGTKTQYTWANPAKLYGDPTTGPLYGNTAFFRPVFEINQQNQDDSTLIDYVKIEQSSDATLAASVGVQFNWPGKWLGDQGKLGTSPTNAWAKKYLEDNYYYQIYSYVIKSGLSLNQYKEVIKKLAHPSGTIMFGLVDIQLFGSVAIDTVVFADIVDLIVKLYLGAESALLSEYADIPLAGRGVGYRTEFGLQKIPAFSIDLDLAHGTNPHGAGRNTPGSPGWIAWEQSPLTSPYANSHYYLSEAILAFDAAAGPAYRDALQLWPYDGPLNHDPGGGGPPFATSNAYTTVTNDTMIWHVKGFRTILGTAYENANVGALFAHTLAAGYDDAYWEESSGAYQHGWAAATGNWSAYGSEVHPTLIDGLTGGQDTIPPFDGDYYYTGYGITSPLDIDGKEHRYVRMKVRRIGPGGYGADSWLGACQPEMKPAAATTIFGPTMGLTPTMWNSGISVAEPSYVVSDRSKYVGSANTTQPSTFVIPADASPNTKSPWHILEWDMWDLGIMESEEQTFPAGGKTVWKDANKSTGESDQNAGGGSRVGYIGFHLCFEPDNKPTGEKFEIEWIQVDDGTGWTRGSYALPAGYTIDSSSSGVGTGGIYKRLRTSESADISEQMIGEFSATVTAVSPVTSEIQRGAPVLYTYSDKKVYWTGSNETDGLFVDTVHKSNGVIFRVSANTANNLDWITTEIIDSETFLYDAPLQSRVGAYVANNTHPINWPSANGKFSGPVILDADPNDNLYVGYVYEDHQGGYSEFDSYADPKPLMLFRLSPVANAQSSLTVKSDPHNLRSVGSTSSPVRGRSNTYVAEQILWGNIDIKGSAGIMIGGDSLYQQPFGEYDDIELSGVGSFVDFSTDAHGSLYIVGSGSQNIIKIFPAANGSVANGVGQYVAESGAFPGREIYELANPTTIDANNNILGNWRPQHLIHGPKQSMFVACDTGYSQLPRYYYKDGVDKFYEEEFTGSVGNWTGVDATLTAPGTYLRVINTGTYTNRIQISDANFTDFSGADYPYVTVRLKPVDIDTYRDTRWWGRLAWNGYGSTESAFLKEEGTVAYPGPSDPIFWTTTTPDADGYTTLTWDISAISQWTGVDITNIQFLFWYVGEGGTPDIDYDIDSICISNKKPSLDIGRGADSVYCYQVVQTQNVATGDFSTTDVYPVFAGPRSREYHATLGSETRNVEGLRLTSAGMTLDNETPPNLYYMTANTVYRVKPKGYSYQIGDAETEQIFPDGYFEDTLNWNTDYEGLLGQYRHGEMTDDFAYESNYMNLQVDSRNRLVFGGKSNLYCYTRGSNTSGEFNDGTSLVHGTPLYNQSNTEFSTLQVVANTDMYTANIDWDFSDSSLGSLGEGRISISDITLGSRSTNSAFMIANNFSEAVYFIIHGEKSGTQESARMLNVVYPNANGSFVIDDGGQSAFMIMGEDPATNTKFETDGTGHGRVNMYRGSGPGKVVLRRGTSTSGSWESTREIVSSKN